MKIVCISTSFIPSNAANSIQVVKTVHAMAELGHDVTLIVPGQEEAVWGDLKVQYGIRTTFKIHWLEENLAYKRYDFAYKAVRKACQMQPDLIYTWTLQSGVLALWWGIPTILEMHDRVSGRIAPWLFRKFCASRTQHRLVSITKALRSVLISQFHIDPSKTEIIIAPDGVDLERYQELPSPINARNQLGIPEAITAGYTGHFYEGRGIDLMFELAKALSEVQFLWVGGDTERVCFWKNRLNDEGVENIILTGFVDNAILPQYQAACDVLLMPYSKKISGSGGGNTADIASPMKMFEYMAAGRAIISSDLPVIHEVLDETTALFCPPDDVDAWIEALSRLTTNTSVRQALGRKAQKIVGAYCWQARVERSLEGFL